jgi:hypothetical protein
MHKHISVDFILSHDITTIGEMELKVQFAGIEVLASTAQLTAGKCIGYW